MILAGFCGLYYPLILIVVLPVSVLLIAERNLHSFGDGAFVLLRKMEVLFSLRVF